MKFAKTILLTAAALLLGTASADARPRLLARRTCVSPAPVRVAPPAPQYDTIPRPLVPVPAIPPGVVMPAVGVLTLPARAVRSVGGCASGICPTR